MDETIHETESLLADLDLLSCRLALVRWTLCNVHHQLSQLEDEKSAQKRKGRA